MFARCNACNAEIQVVRMLRRPAAIVVDAEPHPEGTVILVAGGAMELSPALAKPGEQVGTARYRKHADTCPNPTVRSVR